MYIEKDNQPIDLKNVMFKDFREETQLIKNKLMDENIDFSSIKKLIGEKNIMELAFQQTKVELT
jgi:hypothetical protein